MSFFVADCDALNVILVHLGLGEAIRALLMRCGGRLVTLEGVYKKEAQQDLRAALDPFITAKLCELSAHPSDCKLDKRHHKLLQQVYRVAEKSHRTTSDNDRGLLVEAFRREAPLFTEDRPLRRLAAEWNHPTFDALDAVALLDELGIVDDARMAALLDMFAKRMQDALRQRGLPVDATGCEAVLRDRGSAAARICGTAPPARA